MKYMILAAAIWSGAVHADLLTLKAGSSQKENVNISTGATASIEGASYELTTVGSGLRKKKVVIVPVKVYVGQLLVSDAARFVKTAQGALPSIENQTTVAFSMTFLRDVPASNIKEAFHGGFDVNNLGSDAEVNAFLALVDQVGAAENNGTLTVAVTKAADGSETLAIENKKASGATLKTMKAGKGMASKIMALWLGNVADDYAGELKAELLQ